MPPKPKVQLDPKWVRPQKGIGANSGIQGAPLTELGAVEWFHPEHGVSMGGVVERTNARQNMARQLFGLERPQSVNPKPLNWVRWFTLQVPEHRGDLDESRLVDIADIKKAAKELDIHPGVIWAIGEIETGNRGFLPNGIPVIRVNKESPPTFQAATRNQVEAHRVELYQRKVYHMTGSSEWSSFYALFRQNKYHAIASTGFGRWQVLGINFAHRTAYVDSDTLDPCPPTKDAVEASPLFERYKGLGSELIGEIGEFLFHKNYDLYKGTRKQGGFYQECAYDRNGNLVSPAKADLTPNQYGDAVRHTFADPGGIAGIVFPAHNYYLLRFFEDMHANEREQLWYFTFVVKKRKDLLKAMQAVSKKPDEILLWEKVARLYNGPKHKRRGYAPRLQKYFKLFSSKY